MFSWCIVRKTKAKVVCAGRVTNSSAPSYSHDTGGSNDVWNETSCVSVSEVVITVPSLVICCKFYSSINMHSLGHTVGISLVEASCFQCSAVALESWQMTESVALQVFPACQKMASQTQRIRPRPAAHHQTDTRTHEHAHTHTALKTVMRNPGTQASNGFAPPHNYK